METVASRFLDHQQMTPHQFEALERRLGPALNCLRFQREGLCHTDVQDILWSMAKTNPSPKPPIGGSLISNPFLGSVANAAIPTVGWLRGGRVTSLDKVLTEGVPDDSVGVVIHAKWGVADAKSKMVQASSDLMSMEVPTAPNHCIAILDVDHEADQAVIFDPDFFRDSPARRAIEEHRAANGLKPEQLSFETMRENGWTGELLRTVSCSQLLERCLVLPGGVMAIPKQAEKPEHTGPDE